MFSRSAVLFHPASVLTGCGFTAAFGWLWFAGLREVWLEDMAEHLPIHAYSDFFVFAMGAACVVFGLALGFFNEKRRHWPAAVAHGGSLFCLGLACLVEDALFKVVLVGVAGGGLGTYWVYRLLVLAPLHAAEALAWASGTALALSGPAGMVPLTASGFITGAVGCISAAWVLAGIGTGEEACRAVTTEALAGIEEKEKSLGCEGQSAVPILFARLFSSSGFHIPYVFSVAAVLLLFFFTLSVLFAVPVSHTGMLPVLPAHFAGALSAVFVLRRVLIISSPGNKREQADAVRRITVTALCILALAGFCRFLVPVFASLALTIGSGLLEAVCFAGIIAAMRKAGFTRNGTRCLAGLFLAALLPAVNGGYWAGEAVLRAFGIQGAAVLAGLLILLPAAGMWLRGYVPFCNTGLLSDGPSADVCALPRASEELLAQENNVKDTAGISPVSAKLREDILERFSARERDVAVLLVQGYTNKNIARCLSVTEGTVRWNIKNLNKKVNVMDRRRLISALTTDSL